MESQAFLAGTRPHFEPWAEAPQAIFEGPPCAQAPLGYSCCYYACYYRASMFLIGEFWLNPCNRYRGPISHKQGITGSLGGLRLAPVFEEVATLNTIQDIFPPGFEVRAVAERFPKHVMGTSAKIVILYEALRFRSSGSFAWSPQRIPGGKQPRGTSTPRSMSLRPDWRELSPRYHDPP